MKEAPYGASRWGNRLDEELDRPEMFVESTEFVVPQCDGAG
jgi:hypothetical protein